MSATTSQHPAEPCWLCGELTCAQAAYVPTDDSYQRIYTPGVLTFALCPNCQPQLALGTSASVALVAELRQLALGGGRT